MNRTYPSAVDRVRASRFQGQFGDYVRIPFVVLATLAVAVAPSAYGQARWIANGAGTYDWSNAANWQGGSIGNASTSVAFGGNSTVGNSTQQSAGGAIVINTGNVTITSFTFIGSSNGSLTLQGGNITLTSTGLAINRSQNFASTVNFNSNLIINQTSTFQGFATTNVNGNVSGSGTLVAGTGTAFTYNGTITTDGGVIIRGGSNTQVGMLRANNTSVLGSLAGPIAWGGGGNATQTSGGVLSLLWTTGTGNIASTLDFGATDTSDLLAISMGRGGAVDFTTDTITSGTGNRTLRLTTAGTTGAVVGSSGQGTIRFSGSGFNVTREIEFGGVVTSNATTSLANSANVRLDFTNASGVQRFSGGMSNPSASTGSVTISRSSGNGTTVLSGTMDVAGAVVDVAAGTLVINGNATGLNGAWSIGANGTLAGTGIIGGNATINGVLAAGDPTAAGIGKLTFARTLTLNAGSSSNFRVEGTGRGTQYDAVDLTGAGALGALTYGGTLEVNFGTTFTEGTYSFKFFDFASQSGTFDTVSITGSYSATLTASVDPSANYSSVVGLNKWTFDHGTGALELVVSSIPEPSTVTALAGALVLGCAVYRRRRQ